jgi:hypothetical protein
MITTKNQMIADTILGNQKIFSVEISGLSPISKMAQEYSNRVNNTI